MMINNNWKTAVIDYFISHIKLRIFLISVFPLWFSFGNNYFGTFLGLKQNSELTTKGWIVNGILFFIYIVFNIIIGYIPKRNESLSAQKENDLKSFNDTVAVNEKLIKITSDLCSRKLFKISRNISAQQSAEGINAFSPIEHLDEISLNIRDCVGYITGIPNCQITVSILYRLKEDDEWEWVNQSNLNSGSRFDAKKLVNNPYSTFYHILSNQTLVVFNDKLSANEKNHYVFDDNDNSYNRIGSIACQKIIIPAGNDRITALLSISTYGYRFVDNSNFDKVNKTDVKVFKNNLRDKILSQFTKRISLELLTLYLQVYKSGLNDKQDKKQEAVENTSVL